MTQKSELYTPSPTAIHHIDLLIDAMIRVFLSGTARVRSVMSQPHSQKLKANATSPTEYLRGKGTTDECAELFKDYKKCLTVGFPSSCLTWPPVSDLSTPDRIERPRHRQDAGGGSRRSQRERYTEHAEEMKCVLLTRHRRV